MIEYLGPASNNLYHVRKSFNNLGNANLVTGYTTVLDGIPNKAIIPIQYFFKFYNRNDNYGYQLVIGDELGLPGNFNTLLVDENNLYDKNESYGATLYVINPTFYQYWPINGIGINTKLILYAQSVGIGPADFNLDITIDIYYTLNDKISL